MRSSERDKWMALLEAERVEHRKEIQKLLDRIQFPEVRQVETSGFVEHDPPRDMAELAYVGEIVPEFIQVGGDDA